MTRLLYPITNYYRNGWYCGFTPPFSDRIYYREQCVLVDRMKIILRQRDTLSITVKLYPNAELTDEDPPWVRDLEGVPRLSLSRQPGFSEQLGMHDAVLIDSPTTTLLQAVATKLPVFVLTSIISPPRRHMDLLMRRAACADSAESLMNMLQSYLETGAYPADCTDRTYLKLYGTGPDDGRSAARAREIIQSVIGEAR